VSLTSLPILDARSLVMIESIFVYSIFSSIDNESIIISKLVRIGCLKGYNKFEKKMCILKCDKLIL
jgi:hypothetical protein